MKKYGVIYNYETPIIIGDFEIKKIIRNPNGYILITNKGPKMFANTEEFSEDEIINLIRV
jgi:ribonucleotide monophosphatase NagD (HAD superfamily)